MKNIKYNWVVEIIVEGKLVCEDGSFVLYERTRPEYVIRKLLTPLYGEDFQVSKICILKEDV